MNKIINKNPFLVAVLGLFVLSVLAFTFNTKSLQSVWDSETRKSLGVCIYEYFILEQEMEDLQDCVITRVGKVSLWEVSQILSELDFDKLKDMYFDLKPIEESEQRAMLIVNRQTMLDELSKEIVQWVE